MLMSATPLTFLFRQPGEKPQGGISPDIVTDEAEEEIPEEEEYILCGQCRQAITRPEDRMTVQGLHRHTFANPHGLVFDIGCFKTTRGCGYAGQANDEFTWFAGYSWRVCFCSTCLTHLGWMFISKSADTFHGLVLERLIEPN